MAATYGVIFYRMAEPQLTGCETVDRTVLLPGKVSIPATITVCAKRE